MDYNSFSYYRANPYAHNGFIPDASMTNRKPKLFPSEIPQGEEHLTSRPGRRIFKERVEMDQIQRNSLLQSPQRYPFQNRIAYNKNFRRNLQTVDIEGASAGTKVSESVRNKIKALEVLRQKDNVAKEQILTKSRLIGQSLDAVNQKKRRQLAVQMSKNVESKKLAQKINQNDRKTPENRKIQYQRFSEPKISKPQMVEDQYKRYIAHNSNQKYLGSIPQDRLQFGGFQRYKRQQNQFGAFGSEDKLQNSKIENSFLTQRNNISNNRTNNRGQSIEIGKNPLQKGEFNYHQNNKEIHSILNSPASINNRYRSNPQYMESYQKQQQKRIQENQKTKKIESTIQETFLNNKRQFRRHNPTNLSFNFAARNSLMSTIV